MKHLKTTLVILMCISLILPLLAQSVAATTVSDEPQLVIDANQNEGVYSPNVMGNMFEWASDFMNGSWAQKLSNRNFEIETLNFYASPLYDHFSNGVLDAAKWTPHTYGATSVGTVSISNSKLGPTEKT